MNDTQICTQCGETKHVNRFHFRSKAKAKRRAECRDCISVRTKAHYTTYKTTYKQRQKSRERDIKWRVHALKVAPCVDCGGRFHPTAMDFDHLDPATKVAEIGNLIRHMNSWPIVEREIAKCVLLCANCHRLRTYRQNANRCLCTACVELESKL